MSNVFSLADLRSKAVHGTKYDTVPAYGGTVRLGSCPSGDILEWLAENDDPIKSKTSGLRLLVKSVVDENGERIPKEDREAAVEEFANKDGQDNEALIRVALRLNGLSKAATKEGQAEAQTESKNDSGETVTAEPPSA